MHQMQWQGHTECPSPSLPNPTKATNAREENERKNKKENTIRASYSSRAPLDGTAIDPITRSPNYHHETSKIENLSRANLCLAHGPLELDDDNLDSLKLDHLS